MKISFRYGIFNNFHLIASSIFHLLNKFWKIKKMNLSKSTISKIKHKYACTRKKKLNIIV